MIAEEVKEEYRKLEEKVLDITENGALASPSDIDNIKWKIDRFRREFRTTLGYISYLGRLEYLSMILNNYESGGFSFST